MILRNASLFSQMLALINRADFTRSVKETGVEKGAKGFASWDQLVAMLFCQFAQAKSLRERRGSVLTIDTGRVPFGSVPMAL